MNWALATLLIGAAVLAARPGSAARDRLVGPRPWTGPSARSRRMVRAMLAGPRWRLLTAVTTVAGLAAGVVGGPVGGVIAATYVGLGLHEWDRSAGRRRAGARHAAALDELSALIAELRAGIPPLMAAERFRSSAGAGFRTAGGLRVAAADAGGPRAPIEGGRMGAARPRSMAGESTAADGRLERLTGAVWRLAERTGAPAADLLERIERDARAAGRSAKAAAAQAAGAQTTAVLLAALPLAGIALGTTMGGDPVEVLLRTPWGAACAITALALQCAGLKWAQRLTAKTTR